MQARALLQAVLSFRHSIRSSVLGARVLSGERAHSCTRLAHSLRKGITSSRIEARRVSLLSAASKPDDSHCLQESVLVATPKEDTG